MGKSTKWVQKALDTMQRFCSDCEKQSPVSFVSGPQTRIDTGKAIIGEIVPQALKSYQHEGWDWGTPMAPCIILA